MGKAIATLLKVVKAQKAENAVLEAHILKLAEAQITVIEDAPEISIPCEVAVLKIKDVAKKLKAD